LMDATQDGFAELTADVVSAYVSNNSVPMSELPVLIGEVSAALMAVKTPAPVSQPEVLTPPFQSRNRLRRTSSSVLTMARSSNR